MNQSFTSQESGNHNIHFPFGELLTQEEINELMSGSSKITYSKKDVIFKQNSRVSEIAFVQSGLVKLSREMRKGKNIVLRIVQKGSFIGLPSVFDNEIYEYSAISIEPTTVWFFESNVFKSILFRKGEFAQEIISQLAKDNIFNISRLSSLLYKQLPGRVADIILYFSEEIYKSNSFIIPLTRQELAELAGTTKESLIRTLSEFNNDKIIDLTRNGFTINSMHIIKTLSRLG